MVIFSECLLPAYLVQIILVHRKIPYYTFCIDTSDNNILECQEKILGTYLRFHFYIMISIYHITNLKIIDININNTQN